MQNEDEVQAKEQRPRGSLNSGEHLDREELLTILKNVILKQEHKNANGRIRDIKNEKIRLDSLRVLGYLCYVSNSILKDRDLTDIQKRLEVLESNASKS